MKIAVVGAGAMGCLFGGRLALAGYDVTVVDVVPAVLEAINTNGLLLELDEGKHQIPIKACRAEELSGPIDLMILFTKAMHSRPALESARGFLGSDSYVFTLQNGLGNVELISEFVDLSRVIAGVTVSVK